MNSAPPPQNRSTNRPAPTPAVRLGARTRRFGDLYHSLLTISWPRLMALIVAGFVGANALFAGLYLLGGDAIEGARPGNFWDAFFFSVQTMATIGYGKMGPKTAVGHAVVTIEAFCGLIGFATATGLLFSKFSRPTSRVLFSRVAVIDTWEGAPALMFRMANERSNQIVEATCNVALIRDETTSDGQYIRRVRDLPLMRGRTPVFTLTWTAVHPIGPDSPLRGFSAEWLAAGNSMIVVTFTGIDETFSTTVHARHAYQADEIICDARFVDVFARLPDGRRAIDLAKFHDYARKGSAVALVDDQKSAS